MEDQHHITSSDDKTMLHALRKAKPARTRFEIKKDQLGFGDRVSDAVSELVGSWRFIIIQSVILAFWIILNVVAWIAHWDPYPFILLNLILSFQAAFTAPIIMMSQNRQNAIDRQKAEHDYHVNIKAELEIEALHAKIDLMRETEIRKLIDIIERLEQKSAQ